MRKKRPFEIRRDLARAMFGSATTDAERRAALETYHERVLQEYALHGLSEEDIISDMNAEIEGDRLPTGPYIAPRRHSHSGDGEFKNSAAKLERARYHLQMLVEAAASMASAPPGIEGPFIKDGVVEYRFVDAEKRHMMPMSLIFGDLMHNLRSALDVAVSEIVRLREQDDKDASFPFGTDAKNLDHAIARLAAKKVFLTPSDAVANEIRRMEPHWDGNFLLRSIAEFNNEDKHRNIVISSQVVSSPSINLGPHDGSQPIRRSGSITFNFPYESCLDGFPLISTLERIIDQVEIAVSRLRATVR